MKTTNNLKAAAKITATVLAALLLSPLYANDTVNLGRLETANARIESDLIYTAPDAGETPYTVAVRLENFMTGVERSLLYTAPGAEEGPAEVTNRIENEMNTLEASLIYEAPAEDNFTFDVTSALAAERTEKAAAETEKELVYEVPETEKVFAFDFEMGKIAERLENASLVAEKALMYNAPGAVYEAAAPADLTTIKSIKVNMPVALVRASF